jgi:hypothetical protein
LDNLVALHPLCHVLGPTAVHERILVAQQRGLTVTGDPATTPLLLGLDVVVWLDPHQPRYLTEPAAA